MPKTLEEIARFAQEESRNRGFRCMGIYHLIWAVRKLEPDLLDSWLADYQVEPGAFVKMLENLMRPRRAGGGIPRDRVDAELAERAIELATQLAQGRPADASHLGEVLNKLDEDPIVSLCERFCLSCQTPS